MPDLETWLDSAPVIRVETERELLEAPMDSIVSAPMHVLESLGLDITEPEEAFLEAIGADVGPD